MFSNRQIRRTAFKLVLRTLMRCAGDLEMTRLAFVVFESALAERSPLVVQDALQNAVDLFPFCLRSVARACLPALPCAAVCGVCGVCICAVLRVCAVCLCCC